MSSLITLGEEERNLMRQIEDLIQSGEDQEVIEEKMQELLSLEDASEDKLRGYYHILRALQEHINSVESEQEALEETKERAERALDSLEKNVKWYMEDVAQEDEIYAGPAHFRVNKVGGRRALNLRGDKDEYPQETKKTTIKIHLDGRHVDEDEMLDIINDMEILSNKDGISVSVKERILKSRVRDVLSSESALIEYEPRGTKLKY